MAIFDAGSSFATPDPEASSPGGSVAPKTDAEAFATNYLTTHPGASANEARQAYRAYLQAG
jgi:hypothetical protein